MSKNVGKSRTTLSHPYSWYEKTYGLSISTVIRYHKKGVDLDKPADLLARLVSKPGQKPDLKKLQAFVMGREDAVQLPTQKPPKKSALPPPEDEEVDLDAVDIDGLDESKVLSNELKFLKVECDRARREYQRETNPIDKNVKLKLYQALVNTMRQLAKEAPAAELAAGNVLPKGEVESIWMRAFKETSNQLDALARRLATHPTFRRCDPVEVEETVTAEVNLIKGILEDGSWLNKKSE